MWQFLNFFGCVYHHFSGVELRFPNDFQGDFADDKRKAVLIRGLETPFWNAEKSVIWYAFESETRFCREW